MNEVVALWDKKIGKTLEKTYLDEEHVLKSIPEERMKTYPRILGAAHATSSTFEHCVERRVRVVKSDFHKDLSQRQVICPEPRRTHCLPSLPNKEQLVGMKFESYSTMQSGGEAVCEISDIFLSKSLYGQQSACHPYFNKSPPSRSENPLIHDVQSKKKVLQPHSVSVSELASCGPTYGSSPSVRIEGFSCSSSEKQCIVSALA